MHATRSVLLRAAGAAPRPACTIRVAVWSAYPVAAEALRDRLRSSAVGFDAERLADDDEGTARFDVGLVLHDALASGVAARLTRDGVPVVQLTDMAVGDRAGVRVLPRQATLSAIAHAIAGLAGPAASGEARSALSARELEVVTRYALGSPIAVIASELDIGHESVRTYLRRARTKLRHDGHEASNRAHLATLHANGVLRRRAPLARAAAR